MYTPWGIFILCLLFAGVAWGQEPCSTATDPVTLAWEPSTGSVDHYEVALIPSDGSPWVLSNTPNATPEATLDCHTPKFTVAVRGVSPSGEFGPTSPESPPILCAQPFGADLNGDGVVDGADFGDLFLPAFVDSCTSAATTN